MNNFQKNNFINKKESIYPRKKSIPVLIMLLVMFIIFFILAAVVFLACMVDFVSLLVEKPEDINEVIQERELEEGDYVRIGIYASFGWYAKSYTYFNQLDLADERYYIIRLDNGDFISVSVKGKDIDTLEDITNDTLDFIDDETGEKTLHTPVVFDGEVELLDWEIQGYYDDYIDEGFKDLIEYYKDNYGYEPKIYRVNVALSNEKVEYLIISIIGLAAAILFLKVIKVIRRNIKEEKSNRKSLISGMKKYIV
ncbi:MAG: hypothetical protein IJ053_06010 [Lachnospiraceae bacterium]|nr:hypothetical protein [Lachnospiraceae bacterium]